MNIQIFGKSKCFDTKKAERYFKERRIPYQAIDLLRYGMSRGELTSVKNAVGLEALLDPKAADYALVQHLAYEQDKIERLLEGGDSLFVGNAKGYVRLNLAMPRAIIQTGLERMCDAIRKEQAEH